MEKFGSGIRDGKKSDPGSTSRKLNICKLLTWPGFMADPESDRHQNRMSDLDPDRYQNIAFRQRKKMNEQRPVRNIDNAALSQ
jgi:hypothetical protein